MKDNAAVRVTLVEKARGLFGQMIYIDRARQLLAVRLSSWPDFLNPPMTIDTLRMIHALARELGYLLRYSRMTRSTLEVPLSPTARAAP
jgi:CubicO group peptidase (beta-lactamase class C family)